jgi:hypothetical protein
MWPFKRKKKDSRPSPQIQAAHFGEPIVVAHNETLLPDDSRDFSTGFVLGEVLSGGNVQAGLIGGLIGGPVGGIIGAQILAAEGHQDSSSPVVGCASGDSSAIAPIASSLGCDSVDSSDLFSSLDSTDSCVDISSSIPDSAPGGTDSGNGSN